MTGWREESIRLNAAPAGATSHGQPGRPPTDYERSRGVAKHLWKHGTTSQKTHAATVTSGHEAVGTLCKLFTGATPETDPGACLNAPRLANGGIYLYASPFFPTPIYPSPCRTTPIYLCAFPC
ncbi:unnamed protein product [Boreogadus saida]